MGLSKYSNLFSNAHRLCILWLESVRIFGSLLIPDLLVLSIITLMTILIRRIYGLEHEIARLKHIRAYNAQGDPAASVKSAELNGEITDFILEV